MAATNSSAKRAAALESNNATSKKPKLEDEPQNVENLLAKYRTEAKRSHQQELEEVKQELVDTKEKSDRAKLILMTELGGKLHLIDDLNITHAKDIEDLSARLKTRDDELQAEKDTHNDTKRRLKAEALEIKRLRAVADVKAAKEKLEKVQKKGMALLNCFCDEVKDRFSGNPQAQAEIINGIWQQWGRDITDGLGDEEFKKYDGVGSSED
ncbi:hypothetical protein CC80DRAFT_598967 [Byssothecium circinans]|uniref:Uncharacterized protein n=1 Tax=Byssothecium circinans TaxID=147558 RepID=A0A6A5TB38_9PLEO|nr:hypothetical protein CC80DRAFT_598967 [Byssothecium circinans]